MNDSYKLDKLTNCDWANLFEVRFKRKVQTEKSWVMCSIAAKAWGLLYHYAKTGRIEN